MTRLLFFKRLRVAVMAAFFGTVPAARAQVASANSTPSQNIPLAAAAAAERLKLSGVANLGKISEVLLRGAQPQKKGFAGLLALGITTIVNLRQPGREVEWERKLAESLGLHFVSIPISGWSAPSDAQVAQFLMLFHDPAGQRVFVHCYYGDDRTGVMVASYRIAQQHWTAEHALEEMYSFGFHYYLYPHMESYVRKFPANFAAGPAFSLLRVVPARESPARQR